MLTPDDIEQRRRRRRVLCSGRRHREGNASGQRGSAEGERMVVVDRGGVQRDEVGREVEEGLLLLRLGSEMTRRGNIGI